MEKIDKKKCRDCGIVWAIALALAGFVFSKLLFVIPALLILLLSLIASKVLYPLVWFWFLIGEVMGAITSRVILTIVYLLLIIPISFIFKVIKKDELQLRDFKKSKDTVFIERNHTFSGSDMERPF